MSCDEITEHSSFELTISRISNWLPQKVVDQIKNKGSLTPVEIIRLLSILPAEAYINFSDIPKRSLVFPKDHNMHFLQSQEWFYLALNLTSVDNDKIRIGALSSIVRRSINPYEVSALFSPANNNEVFRSSFSITTTQKHWYFSDTGGYLSALPEDGAYTPGTSYSLPSLTWGSPSKIGLQPQQNQTMKWVIEDSATKAKLDLTLTCKAPILLQGPNIDGIFTLANTGVNYMYYSFPHLEVTGTVTLPATATQKTPTSYKVQGDGWLDHQGGVIKPLSGILAYLEQWKVLLGSQSHRLAWIWVQAQFPNAQTFITGASICPQPKNIKIGDVLFWFGTVMTNGKSVFYDKGQLTVKNMFKSPDLDVSYVIELEVKVSDSISFTSISIFPDQRVYPADQGEIYEGAADTLLNGKTKGYGYIENMAFSSYEELVKQQYSKLGLSGLPIPAQSKLIIGPVITITILLIAIIALTVYFFYIKKKLVHKKK